MNTLARYIIGVVIAAIILFLVWYFSRVVSYILISAVLAIIGKPIVDYLSKVKIKGHHVPHTVASLGALVAIWGFVLAFVALFVPLVFGKLTELSKIDPAMLIDAFREPIMALQSWIQNMFHVSRSDFSITESISHQISNALDISVINEALSSIVTLVGNLAVAMFSITFITFFFLKDENLFLRMVVAIFPDKYENNITHAMKSITVLLIRYFTGLVIESMGLTILIGTTLSILGIGVETAFFMGLIMGVMNVVPYIGPLIGGSICVAIGILSPIDGATTLEMVLKIGCTLMVVKGIDDFIVQPFFYSQRVNAHPLEIFIVILIAGSVAGILGMLLAIPAYNVIRVFAKEFFNNFSLVQKLTQKL